MKAEANNIKDFQNKMLTWFEKNGRDFPWRKTTDPYKIMIAEFLLQKTHVRKVEEIYQEIINHYPDIRSLSNANQKNLERIIKPLGFLNRAERLINASKKIVKDFDGNIPNDFDYLLSIKGIGNYIASAILIFAFEERRVIVDTNVIKILTSEFQIKSEKKRPHTDRTLWHAAQELAPEKNIKEFNWALLDFGASLNK